MSSFSLEPKFMDVRRSVIQNAIDFAIRTAHIDDAEADALRVVGALAIEVAVGTYTIGRSCCPAVQSGLSERDDSQGYDFAVAFDRYMSLQGYQGLIVAQVV